MFGGAGRLLFGKAAKLCHSLALYICTSWPKRATARDTRASTQLTHSINLSPYLPASGRRINHFNASGMYEALGKLVYVIKYGMNIIVR